MRKLFSKHHEDHETVVAEWKRLHEVATSPETEDSDGVDHPQADLPVPEETINEAEEAAERELGPRWREHVETAGRGDDLTLIRDLRDLGRQDERFPAVALASKLLHEFMTADSARLEIDRLNRDGEFIKRWIAGDEQAVLTQRVLQYVVDWDHKPEVIDTKHGAKASAEMQRKALSEIGA